MKIYKSKTWEDTIQFSFVENDHSYYYYFYLSSDTGNWLFGYTQALGLCWFMSEPHDKAVESNWLEVLILTGYIQTQIEKRIKRWTTHY
jgi:hypothetical protein